MQIEIDKGTYLENGDVGLSDHWRRLAVVNNGTKDARAVAKKIVCAVNAHEVLVKAVKAVASMIGKNGHGRINGTIDINLSHATYGRLMIALAKVKPIIPRDASVKVSGSCAGPALAGISESAENIP